MNHYWVVRVEVVEPQGNVVGVPERLAETEPPLLVQQRLRIPPTQKKGSCLAWQCIEGRSLPW
jgi:hypothetical protein